MSVDEEKMTRERFDELVHETKVSKLATNYGDPLRDLMSEVYWEGHVDGYTHAIDILINIGVRLAGCGMNDFFDKHMDNIHRRVDAIYMLEKEETGTV